MESKNLWRTVIFIFSGLVMAAFIAAWILQYSGLLSLIPPPSDLVPTPVADVQAGDALVLYQAAFTAWAALALLIPTYVVFWYRNKSPRAWTVWLACWATGAIAYLIHLAVSMFGFFDGDFGLMTSTTRVSAFWPGMIIAIWWPLDVILALRSREVAGLIRAQRLVIHILVLILFVGGSVAKGELLTVRIMGAILFLAAIASLLSWLFSSERRNNGHQAWR